MKCPSCAMEWTVPAGMEERVLYCPFCSRALPQAAPGPVCRPEDYLMEEEYPIPGNRTACIRTLKKYAGADRVIAVPPDVHCIAPGAFSGCRLWEVTLPETLRELGPAAFRGCHLLRKVSLPEGLRVLGEGAFEGCSGLEEIEIPGSISVIQANAFRFCMGLKRVRLGAGIRRIHERAFGYCNQMQVIQIPDSLEYIHPTAIHCSENIQVMASESWKKAHPELLMRFHYIHGA